jgi:hypothetical protein
MINKEDVINGFDVPADVEAAARIFHVGLPIFTKKVEELSQREARRLVKAIVLFPLQDDDKPLLARQEETLLFGQAMELMEAKMIMVEYARKSKEAAEAVNSVTEETKEEGK